MTSSLCVNGFKIKTDGKVTYCTNLNGAMIYSRGELFCTLSKFLECANLVQKCCIHLLFAPRCLRRKICDFLKNAFESEPQKYRGTENTAVGDVRIGD